MITHLTPSKCYLTAWTFTLGEGRIKSKTWAQRDSKVACKGRPLGTRLLCQALNIALLKKETFPGVAQLPNG